MFTKRMVHFSWHVGTHVAPGIRTLPAWSAGVEPAQTPQLAQFAVFFRPLSRCFPLLHRPPVLGLWCADGTSSAQWTICVPALHLQTRRREEARKGRWACGPHKHPQALLLAERHHASAGGKVLVPLRFLLSTLLLDMKHDATDRFMRDSIRGCDCAQRFLLLHHTMQHGRPL
jgi:hypothetical protein